MNPWSLTLLIFNRVFITYLTSVLDPPESGELNMSIAARRPSKHAVLLQPPAFYSTAYHSLHYARKNQAHLHRKQEQFNVTQLASTQTYIIMIG